MKNERGYGIDKKWLPQGETGVFLKLNVSTF